MSSDDEALPLVNALRLASAARATAAGARALLSDDASEGDDAKNGGDAIIGDAATAAPPGISPAKAAATVSAKVTPVKPPREEKSVSPVPDWIKSATPSKVRGRQERKKNELNWIESAIDRSR